MSSFWKKSMVWLGLEDEGADELPAEGIPEAVPGTTIPPEAQLGSPSGMVGYPDNSSAERQSMFEPPGTVRTIQPSGQAVMDAGTGVRTLPATSSSVRVIEARGFNDAQDIGECFRGGQPVIMNLQLVDRDTARRLVDFASGLTFALRGAMQKVGEQVFLITPANVEVSDDEKQRLRDSGLIA